MGEGVGFEAALRRVLEAEEELAYGDEE